MNYSKAKSIWTGTLGYAVRVLLDLNDSSGSFLWFWDTVKGLDGPFELNAGQVTRLMLIQRLADFDE